MLGCEVNFLLFSEKLGKKVCNTDGLGWLDWTYKTKKLGPRLVWLLPHPQP